MGFDITLTDGIATVAINKPEALNALSISAFAELCGIFETLATDAAVEGVILTGKGRAFCAGASLASFVNEDGTTIAPADLDAGFTNAINRLMLIMTEYPKPVVNAVNGIAAGGGLGLALGADVVIASDSAAFYCGFVPMLGIIPDCGASWLLPRLMGRNRALGHALLGEGITAQKALDSGLVYQLFPAETLMAGAQEIALRLARTPRRALVETRRAFGVASQVDLTEMLDIERKTNVDLVADPEFREGVTAFLEKRQPDFRKVANGG